MNFVLFVYCNIVATHTYDGHTGFTFTRSFPAGFTRRNIETAHTIVNMIQVINKEARGT